VRQAATALAVVLAICSAIMLYAISYDTRRLEARVHALEKTAERAESDIAVAKAELSHLSRPERIEPLARAQGLGAPARQQFVAEDRLPRRVGKSP
jgi:cell division protein FtsL